MADFSSSPDFAFNNNSRGADHDDHQYQYNNNNSNVNSSGGAAHLPQQSVSHNTLAGLPSVHTASTVAGRHPTHNTNQPNTEYVYGGDGGGANYNYDTSGSSAMMGSPVELASPSRPHPHPYSVSPSTHGGVAAASRGEDGNAGNLRSSTTATNATMGDSSPNCAGGKQKNSAAVTKKLSPTATSSSSAADSAALPVSKGAGFFTQMLATVRRQVIQKRRMWISLLLELLLPVAFVIGLLGISLASSRTDVPPTQYVNPNGPVLFGQVVANDFLCYSSSGNADADLQTLLPQCPAAGAYCLPVSNYLPIEGLCVQPGKAAEIESFARGLMDAEEDVEVANYDEYVLFKWAMSSLLPDSDDLFSQRIARARQTGRVFVTPDSGAGAAWVNYMQNTHVLFKHSFGGYFGSRDEAVAWARNKDNEGKMWAHVLFTENSADSIGFILSMNRTAQEVTYKSTGVRVIFSTGLGEKTYARFLVSGALTIQKTVNDYFVTDVLGLAPVDVYPTGSRSHLVLTPMPTYKYTDDQFLQVGGTMGPLMLVLAFLYPVSQLSKRLVEEKEQRLREGTMIMGLGKAAFFSSWLLVYYVQMFFVSIIIAIILKVGITKKSDFFVIWVAYLLFCFTTVNLAALLSTFFSKAKIAALCVPLIYFLFSIPGFAIPDTTGPAVFYALSFLCPVPFSVALRLVFGYETNNGMGWNAFVSATDKPYNYGVCFMWFIIDFILYIILMLYFDLVIPKEWGTTLHPCFCFCCCCKAKRGSDGDDDTVMQMENGGTEMAAAALRDPNALDNAKNHMRADHANNSIQDYPRPNREATVHIANLRKEFPGSGKKINVAVDGFELRMFPDTITVLLGHNGAGKTTAMNMMTGMMSPTSGDITIYGNSILTDMQAIRRDIGFCPQHNILWDDLTCFEHLQYFARLKGMSGSEVDEEAVEMLVKVDLLDKKDVFSCNLSGGQKRKLSVAIAFMGRARLVLLDEPTAGMDVAARRHTWDVLKEMSKGRTILLTTHFMDEADLLGNRIAVMSKGCLHSYGTSMYLKHNLGAGYQMKIASNTVIENPDAILAEVRQMLPGASIREAKGQELAIALPKDDSRKFPDVIRHMDAAAVKRKLAISSVSMSATGLEDVFLAIAHQEDLNGKTEEEFAEEDDAQIKAAFEALGRVYVKLQEKQGGRVGGAVAAAPPPTSHHAARTEADADADALSPSPPPAHSPSSAGVGVGGEQTKVSGFTGGGFTRQFLGMFMKRFNHGRRDRCAICLQVFAPIVCIVIAMALGKIGPPSPELLWYDNDMYGSVGQIMAANNCPDLEPYFDRSFEQKSFQALPSTLDFSEYLLDTYNSNGKKERMVSFGCAVGNGGPATAGDDNYLFANATGFVTAPQSMLQLYHAKVRAGVGNYATMLKTAQWPLPFTDRQQTQIDAISALLVALFVLIPFTFVPSTFVAYVVRERECKSKHLQFISGASYSAYWLANFVFDLISYLIVVAIAFIIFAAFSQDWAVGSAEAGFGTLVLFLLYGLSGIWFAYLVSFLFDNHSTAQTVIMMVNFLVGFLLVLLMFFLREIDSTADAAEVIVYFLRIVPPFALGDGLFLMVTTNALSSIQGDKSPFDLDVAGWDMIYMGILSIGFMIATIIIDNPMIQKKLQMKGFLKDDANPLVLKDEDEDVARERRAVETGARPTDVVQVQGLRKEFSLGVGKKKVAVQNITFGVKPGEVFGFLGTNGAGKTTTMSMLTTEIIPTCGSGRIGGYDIVQESERTRRLIGYCPQFDAIMDLLTPVEHLKLFSALRGIPREDTADVIEALINSCALQKYRDVPAGSLSGGNKRKLSVAMALIGGPSIVFLDEPSAGMDPHARRQMWDVIIFVAKHSSVVLTTHHLEEVDVLAHRVGIMDAGLMKCLGSLEHLKMKFGSGFEMTIQITENGFDSATNFIQRTYPTAVQVEARQQRILYTLPFDSTDLASLFETIQKATDDPSIGIIDYTVQQTSLEQVFMRISEQDNVDHAANRDPSSNTPGGGGEADNDDDAEMQRQLTGRLYLNNHSNLSRANSQH